MRNTIISRLCDLSNVKFEQIAPCPETSLLRKHPFHMLFCMKDYLKKHGITLLLVAFVAFWFGYSASDNCSSCLVLPEEKPTPTSASLDWTLKDLQGEEHTLSDLGKPITVLAFWGTECPVCLKEMPELEAFYQIQQSQPVALVGITANEAEVDAIAATVAEKGVTYPILRGTPAIREAYSEFHKLPAIFVLDEQLQVVNTFHGGVTADELSETVKPLLSSPQE